MRGLAQKIGVEDETYSKLVLLILHSFFSGIFVSIYFSIANTEFVNRFDRKLLPYGYLLSGVIGYIIVHSYGRLLKKGGYKAFLGGLIFLASLTILFRVSLFFADEAGTKSLCFIIFLFAMPFLSLSWLQQSGILIKTLDYTSTKKYAGIVNSGATVASIIGYITVPIVSPHMSSPFDMLIFGSISLIIAIFILTKIKKHLESDLISVASVTKSSTANLLSLSYLLKQPFIRCITICGGISMMAFYLIDFTFLVNAKYYIDPGNIGGQCKKDLTTLLSIFFAAIKFMELIVALCSSSIFRKFGLKVGLVILPLACLSFSIIAAISFNVFINAFIFIFAVFVLKLFERVLNKAIEEPAYKNLYQILPAAERLTIQAKIDGGTKQLFIVLASVILIIYNLLFPYKPGEDISRVGLIYFVIPVFIYWVFTSRKLVKYFQQQIHNVLMQTDDVIASAKGTYDQRLQKFLTSVKNKKPVENTLQEIFAIKFRSFFNKHSDEAKETASRGSLVKETNNEEMQSLEIDIDAPLLIIPPGVTLDPANSGVISDRSLEEELVTLTTEGKTIEPDKIRELLKRMDDVKQNYAKKMILNLVERTEPGTSSRFLLDFINFPDYYFKKQAYRALEKQKFKFNAATEVYFRRALEDTLNDLMFILSIIVSIPVGEDHKDIRAALIDEERLLKKRILSILSWKYDNAAIKVIGDTIFARPKKFFHSNSGLAMEFIEIIVDNELKPKILPALENDFYARRMEKLGEWYFYPKLSLEKAFTAILDSDYTRVGTWTKACVLKKMVEDGGSLYKTDLAGFTYHQNVLLRTLSHGYREEKDGLMVNSLLPRENPYFKLTKFDVNVGWGNHFYEFLKGVKDHAFFKKVSYNDLANLVRSIDVKDSGQLKIDINDKGKHKPYFITEGKLKIFYHGETPKEIFTKGFIGPLTFGNNKVRQIVVTTKERIYSIPQNDIANLILSSETLMNYIDKRKF
jgi:hypothetical protein